MDVPANKLTYCINSFVSYFDVAGVRCLNSLVANGVPKNQIVVCMGGFDTPKYETKDGVLFIYANHNSSDYTSYIESLKIGGVDNWCFLHDTCEVYSPQFYQRTMSFIGTEAYQNAECSTFHHLGLTNLGIYKHSFLISIQEYIESLRNVHKFRGIYAEMSINRLGRNANFPCEFEYLEPIDVYGNNVLRRVVKYDCGLLKYQGLVESLTNPKLDHYKP